MIGNYATELLAESDEEELLRRLHAEHYLALAVAGEQALPGSSQRLWLIRLEADHDNLRAALRWALERAEVEIALHLSGSLLRFWELHGHLREGRQWLAKALSMSTEPAANQDHSVPHMPYSQLARAKALFAAGRLAERQGDNASAWPLLEESAAMAREIGDRPLLASILHNLANLASYNEDYIVGRRLAEESLALRTEMGDRLGMANTLHNLGFQAEVQGDFAAAGAYFDQSLAISREVQDAWGIAYSLDALALIRLEQGDAIPAHMLLTESLALRRDLGDKSGIARSLERLARAAAKLGQSARAARLFGAAEALREQEDIPIVPVDRPVHEKAVAQARIRLAEPEWDKAWREGRAMKLEEAIAYALEDSHTTGLTQSPS
jgi:tetratricopeptide (TPR) repeat protein